MCQLVVNLGSPSLHHTLFGVRSAYFKCVDHATNRHLVEGVLVEPVVPIDRRCVEENVPNESQQQVSHQSSFAFFLPNFRKEARYRFETKLRRINAGETCRLVEEALSRKEVHERHRRALLRDPGEDRQRVFARRSGAVVARSAAVSEYRLLPQRPLRRRQSRLLLGAVLAPSRFLPARHCNTSRVADQRQRVDMKGGNTCCAAGNFVDNTCCACRQENDNTLTPSLFSSCAMPLVSGVIFFAFLEVDSPLEGRRF